MLVLTALVATGVVSPADAKVGGHAAAAGARKISKGAQVKLNRMKAKMALRPKGSMAQKTRRQLRLGKRQLMRAMGRREVGLHGSEAKRARSAFARDGIGHPDGPDLETAGAKRKDNRNEEELEKLGVSQRRKMRATAKRQASKAFKKLREKRRD